MSQTVMEKSILILTYYTLNACFARDLGGCLGLTFGASLLTIVEVIEYMAKSVIQILSSYGGQVKKNIIAPIKVKPLSDK